MVIKTNNEKLKKLLIKHGLNYREAADLIGVKKGTVKQWCSGVNSKRHRKMNNIYMKMFLIKLLDYNGK
jgi:transcriptional regulator with XRE-family HTH domain